MSAKKVNKISIELLIIVSSLFVLLLTVVNIDKFLTPQKVLGLETQANTELLFWENLLKEHPNYIPGWIEIGRIDKVEEIDPNYF